jgi:predicted aspartyl protease
MRGRFDYERNLPLIDLVLNGEPVTLLVDTGFTGTIAVGLDCSERIGLQPGTKKGLSKTAGGPAEFTQSTSRVLWFDGERETTVLIWKTDTVGPVDGLIGAKFLVGHILIIDYNEGDVLIKNPALLSTLGES